MPIAIASTMPIAIPAVAPVESLGLGEAGNVDAEDVDAGDVDVEDVIAEDDVAEDDRLEKGDDVGWDVAVVAREPIPVDPGSGTAVSESHKETLGELSSSVALPHLALRVCVH
jgi:hypothetical protein